MRSHLFIFWLGLTTANFLCQMFTHQDWETAFERSFFQGWALLLAYFLVISDYKFGGS